MNNQPTESTFVYDSLQCQGHGATACDFEAADGNFHMESHGFYQQFSSEVPSERRMLRWGKNFWFTPDNMLLMLLAEKDDLPETNIFYPDASMYGIFIGYFPTRLP